MSDSSKKVACRNHGETPATFLCRHLAEGIACGYHSGGDSTDRWPDAWCDGCHRRFLDAGSEWTAESEKGLGLRLSCTFCYEEDRERNLRMPAELIGSFGPLSTRRADDLVHGWIHNMQARQEAAAQKGFDLVAEQRFQLNAEQRKIEFGDGRSTAFLADTLIVGSLSKKSSTWLWSWANDHLEAELLFNLRRPS